jgi:hypothetical protein
LTVSGFTPAVYVILIVDSNRVIGTACDRDDRCFLQHFDIGLVIVGEEVRNIVRRADRLNVLKQAELSFKASTPTKDVSDVAQSQGVEHAAGNGYDLLVAKFGDEPGSGRKDSAS